MSAFILEIPCDDIFYGFQTVNVYSSIENALNAIKSKVIKPRKLIYNALTEEIIQTSLTNNSNHKPCYKASIFNIKEYPIDKEVHSEDYIEITFVRIDIGNKHYTFKDEEMYNCHEHIYYVCNQIKDNESCRVKFLKHNKSINLKLNIESDELYEI